MNVNSSVNKTAVCPMDIFFSMAVIAVVSLAMESELSVLSSSANARLRL